MLIALGLALTTVPVSVTTPSDRHPPLQSAEFTSLLGRWSGAGTFERTGAKVESDLEISVAAGAEAVQLNQRERAPNRFVYVGLWSADTGRGGLVMMLAGNNGGGARLLRSAGWRDGCLRFQSGAELKAWFAAERFSFCSSGSNQLKVTYELSRDGATWVVGDTQLYSRVSERDGASPSAIPSGH